MTYRVSGNGWFASAWRNNPVTLAMVLAMAWIFLLGFGGAHLAAWLVFDTGNPVNLTLGAFTYPLVTNDIIALLLGGYMLWIFGSSLERGWGTRFYVLYLLVVNLITLVVWEGGLLLFAHGTLPMSGPWLMLATLVVAWASLNPEEKILLYFVLPIQAIWLAALVVVVMFFTYPGMIPPSPLRYIMGFFTLGGPAAAVAYDWYRRKWAWIPRRRDTPARRPLRLRAANPFAALLRPWQEWQRRRRVAHLEKTFRFGDDEPRGKR